MTPGCTCDPFLGSMHINAVAAPRLPACLPAPAASCSSSLLPAGRTPPPPPSAARSASRQGQAASWPCPHLPQAGPAADPSFRPVCVPFSGMPLPALHALCARTDRADAACAADLARGFIAKAAPLACGKKKLQGLQSVAAWRQGKPLAATAMCYLASIVVEGDIHMGVVILTAGGGRGEEFLLLGVVAIDKSKCKMTLLLLPLIPCMNKLRASSSRQPYRQ
jgi:hypothetical protein